jgi:hypothetical protein
MVFPPPTDGAPPPNIATTRLLFQLGTSDAVVAMRSAIVVPVTLLFLMGGLAGCIGGDDDIDSGQDENRDPTPTETTGSIHGTIIDGGFSPIAGVDMILATASGDPLDAAMTNTRGEYTFNDLQPGRYRVIADSPCCQVDVRAVEVNAGEVTSGDMQLERVRTIQTHVDRDGHWQGFIGCAFWIWPGTESSGCHEVVQDENDDREHAFSAREGLMSVVVAIEWEANPLSTTERLRHRLYIDTGDGFSDVERHERSSPIIYRVDHDPQGSHTNFADLEEINFRMTIGAGGRGVQESPAIAYQQSFQVYYHLFYGEYAEEGYDPRPDA